MSGAAKSFSVFIKSARYRKTQIDEKLGSEENAFSPTLDKGD